MVLIEINLKDLKIFYNSKNNVMVFCIIDWMYSLFIHIHVYYVYMWIFYVYMTACIVYGRDLHVLLLYNMYIFLISSSQWYY